MQETLLLVGIACIIAAIVGGGLKILHVELPAIASVHRQVLLALAGSVLVVVSFTLPETNGPAAPTPVPAEAPATAPPAPPAGQVDPAPGGIDRPPPPGLTDPPDITLSTSSGPAGTSVSVSGTSFAPRETVIIRFHTRELTRVETDRQGEFSAVLVEVPPDWPFTGQFHFRASGRSSLRSASAPFQVT